MSEEQSQMVRPQVIAEKKREMEVEKKREMEVEKKRRQLEEDRRQLQHLKSKALRERWLLDGAPSAGPEVEEAQKKLQEDEAKTQSLEETIVRLEQELEDFETGVSLTTAKKNQSEISKKVATIPHLNAAMDSVKEVKVHVGRRVDRPRRDSDMMKAAMYSVEIIVEKDRLTGETKVLSTNTVLPKDLSQQAVKVYEDDLKVVHAVCGSDCNLENGVRLLSSSEVDELINKADAADAAGIAKAAGVAAGVAKAEGVAKLEGVAKMEGVAVGVAEGAAKAAGVAQGVAKAVGVAKSEGVARLEGVAKMEGVVTEGEAPPRVRERAGQGAAQTPRREIMGLEAKPPGGAGAGAGGATAEHPVSMVFMGYQDVEDEAETQEVLGLRVPVTAQLVLITEGVAKEEPPPANGTTAVAEGDGQGGAGGATEPEAGGAEPEAGGKRPCKCCSVM